jgi:hypothetical protein
MNQDVRIMTDLRMKNPCIIPKSFNPDSDKGLSMTNANKIEIGKDVQDGIVIAGDSNTATINIYHQQAALNSKPSEPPPKVDYDRLPIPSSDLIGREKELELLDNAFSDPKKYVISIIAGGGVGKSALTYSWLDRIKPDYGGAKMIFGWSFYNQGSDKTQNSSAPFFQEAFRFFNYDKQLPKDEVEKGKPLVGKAGKLFRKYFEKFGLNKTKYLITNVVLCQTLNPDGTTGNPTPEVIEKCKVMM